MLKGNSTLFKLLFPLYQSFYNRSFAQKIEKHALGTFVTGFKAEEDFLKRGLNPKKIKQLFYYALKPLERVETVPKGLENFKFKHYFLCVSALSQRKGIDFF